MERFSVSYDGILQGLLNLDRKSFKVLYSEDVSTGEVSTVSILVDEKTRTMITFDYRDLKRLVEPELEAD